MATTPQKPSLIGMSMPELSTALDPWTLPSYRAEQIYKWVHHHQVSDFADMSNLPKTLRSELSEAFELHTLKPAFRAVSKDGTIKYLWELTDGRQIESVFIPEATRTTICISSQVGCALGCDFCATAKMGFLRNLTAGEIVEQVIRVQQDTGQKITNVVLMGMGEPFLNYPRVIQACHILCDPAGLAISAKKITISTVGVVPRIRQYADEEQPFSLAISLHAPTQELRRSIMPIADKFDLQMLMDSAHHYTGGSNRRRITFEYVLLKGVNDSPTEAKQLLKLLAPLRCKLNLIPYNDTGIGFIRPEDNNIQRFLKPLEQAPFTVTVRKNRGNDIAAACGQLFVEVAEDSKARSMKA